MPRREQIKPGSARFLLLLLPLALLSVGAAANDDLRAGKSLEQQGELEKAAGRYLRILDRDPDHKKARKALMRVGPAALDRIAERARSAEAERRYRDALASWRTLRQLRERMLRHRVPLEPEPDPGAEIERVTDLLAADETAAGDAALADSRWAAATAHLGAAEALRPGDAERRESLARAWRSWAEEDRAAGRLRVAAERFAEAARVPEAGTAADVEDARALYRFLTRASLDAGACRRAAMTANEALQRLGADPVLEADEDEARRCARTLVNPRVSAAPNLVEGRGDIAAAVDAALRAELKTRGSRFIELLASGAASPADHRRLPGVDGRPVVTGPYRLELEVQLVRFQRSMPSVVRKQTRSSQSYDCVTLSPVGPTMPGRCLRDVTLIYDEYTEPLVGTAFAVLRIRDRTAGDRVIAELDVQVSAETGTRWAGNFLVLETGDGYWSTTTTGFSVVLGDDLKRMSEVDRRRRDNRAALVDSLIKDLSGRAAELVLSRVDTEPLIPDPTALPEPAAPGE